MFEGEKSGKKKKKAGGQPRALQGEVNRAVEGSGKTRKLGTTYCQVCAWIFEDFFSALI